MSETPAAVTEEIEATLEEHRLHTVRLVPISRFHGTKRGRYTFLSEGEDGSRVKVRYLVTSEAARKLEELRSGLEPAFAPVLHRRGAVLVERWVEGRPLSTEEAEARAEGAGALLGRLHARTVADGIPAEQSTAGYLERAEADLGELREAGRLSEEEADSLLAALGRLDPGLFRGVLVHRDFCPENFILDSAGRLCVVDNEWFEIGAAGFDLGRTFHRWPMPEQEVWSRFLAGYRSACAEPEALDFWTIASTLFGARSYLRLDSSRLPPLLALLRELRAGRNPVVAR